MTWVATPGWQNWSRAMGDAALAALKATEGENLEALVAGNGRLVESCEGCIRSSSRSSRAKGSLTGTPTDLRCRAADRRQDVV
jgi:hypothetical protein